MGRYYKGDISGKFGFACQPSNDGEYFGAIIDESYINYVIPNIKKKEVVKRLEVLIKQFKKKVPKAKELSIKTNPYKFWDFVDNDWYQDHENGLLASRIEMGLKIVDYFEKNPEYDIYFTAEN